MINEREEKAQMKKLNFIDLKNNKATNTNLNVNTNNKSNNIVSNLKSMLKDYSKHDSKENIKEEKASLLFDIRLALKQ